jgi:uncharacterized membrane protein
MNAGLLSALTLFAALGSGVMAGFFFAFSAVIMAALGRLPPAQGIAAMQLINVVVINPLFGGIFFGTGLASVALIAYALFNWQAPGAAYLLAGSLLYLVGTILVTIAFNVPRNNALAAVDPASPAGASLWADYLTTWTAWNHLRTVAALAAAAAFTLALTIVSTPPGRNQLLGGR